MPQKSAADQDDTIPVRCVPAVCSDPVVTAENIDQPLYPPAGQSPWAIMAWAIFWKAAMSLPAIRS